MGRVVADVADRQSGTLGVHHGAVVDEAEDIASHGPRAVFILTGTNDIRDGHPPSWTVDRLGEILDRLRQGAPDSVVVLQTILPRSDARDAVRAANLAIRELASERGVQVLDLYAAFDDGTGALRAAETTDGVHLAPAGYRRWAALLEPTLQALPSS